MALGFDCSLYTIDICQSIPTQEVLKIDDHHSAAYLLLGAIYQEHDASKVRQSQWLGQLTPPNNLMVFFPRIGYGLSVQSGRVFEGSNVGLSGSIEMCPERRHPERCSEILETSSVSSLGVDL